MIRTVKISALILSILVVIAGLPMTVFGAEFNEWLESNASEAYSGTADVSLQKGVYELNELREENVKHFRQEDGSNVAVVYSDAVHYMDADGEWQDIDNTLSDDGNEYGTSNARIKFAKKITGNETLFTLHENNRKITLSLDGAIKKTQGSVRASESVLSEDATQLQKLMELSKLSSTISYADILEGVDLEYDVVSMNIKERIVVKEKLSSYDYLFTLSLNNLSARLAEDGSVELYDTSTNETAYVIPAPFMYDSAEEYSDAVYYTLTDLGNGKYKLLISADDEWINAENRTFPVTIDPAVYPATKSDVTDTYINSYSKTLAPYNYQYLYVGNTTQFYWKTANMPTIPKSAYITKATFTAKYIGGTTETSTYYFGAYQVTSDWDNTLTWNKYKASPASGAYVYADIVDYTTATLSAGTPDKPFYTWDVTEIVRNWKNPDNCKGICISDIPGYTTKNTKFASSEYTTVAYRPKLLIEYRDMKGVEDYWSYTAQNIGNAGTGYVNNATGNLTLAISTLATTDALFGYAPTLVYNSSIANINYTSENASVPYTQTQAGYGFKLSTQESIVLRNYPYENDTTKTYYIWADSDGTEHAFYPDDNNTGLFYDEDGLGLKLTTESDIETGTVTVTITDRSYNQKIFTAYNGGWVMSSIRDTSGNELVFTLDANARVTKISVKPNGLSAIDFLTFTYELIESNETDESNELSIEKIRIENSSAKRAVIFNYSSNYLTQVKYAHITTSGDVVDYSASYEYDSDGNIVKARDNTSLYEVNYTYTNKKVTAVTEKGGTTFGTTGQTVGISYNGSQTEVRSSGKDDIYNTTDDLLTKYVFDYAGRTITAYSTDLNGTTIYGASAGEYVSDNELAENHIKTSATVSDVTANYITNGGFELSSNGFPEYWTFNNNGSSYAGIVQGEEAKFGSKELKISPSGEASVEVYQNVFLGAGEYTLSADFAVANNEFSEVYLEATDSNGNIYSQKVSFDQTTQSENKVFASLTFNVSNYSDGGDTIKVAIRTLWTPSGTSLHIDNVTLQEGNGVGKFSYVNYGSFEQSISSYAPSTFWSMSGGSGLTFATLNPEFDQSIKIAGSLAANKYVYQTIDLNYNSKEDQPAFLRLSGFGKAVSQMWNPRSTFALRAEVIYAPDENNPEATTSHSISFDKSTENWQFAATVIPLDSSRIVDYVVIYCDYGYNFGTAYFDDIKLVTVDDYSASASEYNEKGLLEAYRTGAGSIFYGYHEIGTLEGLVKHTVTSGTNKITFFEYNTSTKLVSYEYIYTVISSIDLHATLQEVKDNIFEIADELGIDEITSDENFSEYANVEYSYNSYGLPTYVSTRAVGNSNPLVSTYTYNVDAGSKIFGSVNTQTDTSGYVAKYFYDANNGNLLATVGGKTGDSTYDQGYAYTYDAVGRITNVYPASCSATATSATANTNSASAEYSYNDQSRLSSIATATTTYTFTYDVFGNSDTIGVGTTVLVNKDYNANNGKLQKETYANNFSVNYVYDTLDRVKEIWYNNGSEDKKAYTYTYDTNGNIAKLEDHLNTQATIFKYDNSGRPVYSCKYNLETDHLNSYANEQSISVVYDEKSRVAQADYGISYSPTASFGTEKVFDLRYSYIYDEENRLAFSSGALIGGKGLAVSYSYDAFNRLSGSTTYIQNGNTNSVIASENYTYKVENGNETALIDKYNVTVGLNQSKYRFEYDSHGNITAIYNNATNALRVSYEYDNLNRLTRENNKELNKTYVYTYDNGGNITSKKTYAYTTGTLGAVQSTKTYTYGDSNWKDQLTAYNGYAITYDASGNPLIYHNGSEYTFTWTQGRRLATATMGAYDLSFEYNESGIRTSKTVNGITHEYVVDGTKIISDCWLDSAVRHYIAYIYDAKGVIGMVYRNHTMDEDEFEYYLFEKNLQGDITAVYDEYGGIIVEYTYDAWGNVTETFYDTTSNGQYNSFRYRGYFYDEETGLYYLNSRYYDPATGRFINADVYVSTGQGLGGYNMYAYCRNEPVFRRDSLGTDDVCIAHADNDSNPLNDFDGTPTGNGGMYHYSVDFSVALNSSLINGGIYNCGYSAYGYTSGGYGGSGKAPSSSGNAVASQKDADVCFIAGTLIETEDGSVPIEAIVAGMRVYAHNTDTGETLLKEVLQTFVNETDELIYVTVDGEEIVTTPSHPFYVPRQGWTDAIHLKAGDILLTVNGEYVVVEQVQHEILEAPVTVYNFEVEDFHTYYVTESALLVHNTCGYEVPKGGGGVSDTIQIGDITVTFGHGGRRLGIIGQPMETVNKAIAQDVINRPSAIGKAKNASIWIDGVEIGYSYFTRSPNLINVGTYHPGPRKEAIK